MCEQEYTAVYVAFRSIYNMGAKPAATITATSAPTVDRGVSNERQDHYRKNVRCIVRKLLATCLLIALLIVCLWMFSRMGHLKRPDQRGFNALAILLTGTMSLCIGSVLTYLGSMIRWPLLARTAHKAVDVCGLPFS